MKYIVTGGMGFIGSNLSEYLAKDHDVTILDDGATGRMSNVEGLISEKKVQFEKGSITHLPLLNNLFEDVDGVFHQGAIPSVPRSVKDPVRTNEANITGTLNVLTAARDCGVEKVVFASSSVDIHYVRQKGDVRDTCSDAKKAEKLLGWNTEININTGIPNYINRIQNRNCL